MVQTTYLGESPDIGAYEFGEEYWMPGITWDLSTVLVKFSPRKHYIF